MRPAFVSRLRVKHDAPLDFINRSVGQFAAYVYGKADDAVVLHVQEPPPHEKMSAKQFEEVTRLMHDRYCVRSEGATREPPQPSTASLDKSQKTSKKDGQRKETTRNIPLDSVEDF